MNFEDLKEEISSKILTNAKKLNVLNQFMFEQIFNIVKDKQFVKGLIAKSKAIHLVLCDSSDSKNSIQHYYKTFTKQDANVPTAFYQPSTSTVYVDKNIFNNEYQLANYVHEFLHALSHTETKIGFKKSNTFGNRLNEGATVHFTKLITGITTNGYAMEVPAYEIIRDVCSETDSNMINYYFSDADYSILLKNKFNKKNNLAFHEVVAKLDDNFDNDNRWNDFFDIIRESMDKSRLNKPASKEIFANLSKIMTYSIKRDYNFSDENKKFVGYQELDESDDFIF